jgi:hypothetical protein
MYSTIGVVRDYDPATDSCSVELQGMGIIEVWMDGIKAHAGVDRSQLVGGTQVTIDVPDPNRLCEAQIVGVVPQGIPHTVDPVVGLLKRLSGRSFVSTDGAGNGSTVVTFPSAFTSTPTISAQGDFFTGVSVPPGLVLTTQFEIDVAAPALANSVLSVSWSAVGGA